LVAVSVLPDAAISLFSLPEIGSEFTCQTFFPVALRVRRWLTWILFFAHTIHKARPACECKARMAISRLPSIDLTGFALLRIPEGRSPW